MLCIATPGGTLRPHCAIYRGMARVHARCALQRLAEPNILLFWKGPM